MRAPLVPVTLACLVGVVCRMSTALPIAPVVALAGYGTAMACWRRLHPHLRAVGLLVVWACVGALRMDAWVRAPEAGLRASLPATSAAVRLHGLVDSDPDEQDRDDGRMVAVVRVWHADRGRGWEPLAGWVRAALDAPRTPLRYGDEVLIEGAWEQTPSPEAADDASAALLARRRIAGFLRAQPQHGLVILRHGRGHPWVAAAYRLRARWSRALAAVCDRDEAAMLRAVLFGERAALEPDLTQAFMETGTIHLLVVSGFNVGLVALVLELLLRLLRLPWRLRLVLTGLLLGGYAAMTDAQPPVVRATVMAWVVLGAAALDRAMSWPNALALAAAGIVWSSPAQLLDPGFQLSFGAVASLLAFSLSGQRWVEGWLRWLPWERLRRYVAISLSATGSVWMGLWPLLAWHFHLISPVAVVANLVVAPLVSALVMLGTGALLLGSLWTPFLLGVRPLLSVLLLATHACVRWCHALPGGAWWVARPSPATLLGYYGLLVLTLVGRRRGWRATRLWGLWAVGLAAWLVAAIARPIAESRWLQAERLSVGQGTVLLIRAPGGAVTLAAWDLREASATHLIARLRARGITTIDALLLPRVGRGEVATTLRLMDAVRVRRLLTDFSPHDTMGVRHLWWVAAQRAIAVVPIAPGRTVALAPGVAAALETLQDTLAVRLTDGAVRFVMGRTGEAGGITRWRTDGVRLFLD